MKLAFEDINKKLVDVVSVADADAEQRVDDIIVEIPKFGKISKTELCLIF